MTDSPTGVFNDRAAMRTMCDMDILGIGEIIRGLATAALGQPLLALLAVAPIAGLLDT